MLDTLIGEWDTRGSHPMIEGPIRGRASFEWLAGHRFLIWRSASTPDTVPAAISIIGDVTAADTFPLHYFDSRGVARVYTASLKDGVLRFWRDEPGFAQRATVVLEGDALHLRTELNGKADLEMTYTRH